MFSGERTYNLESIKVDNFKLLKDIPTLKIKPITLIFGQNGSGKSSVLKILFFALYGTHPSKVTHARAYSATGVGNVFQTKVAFVVEDKEYMIHRKVSRKGKVWKHAVSFFQRPKEEATWKPCSAETDVPSLLPSMATVQDWFLTGTYALFATMLPTERRKQLIHKLKLNSFVKFESFASNDKKAKTSEIRKLEGSLQSCKQAITDTHGRLQKLEHIETLRNRRKRYGQIFD